MNGFLIVLGFVFRFENISFYYGQISRMIIVYVVSKCSKLVKNFSQSEAQNEGDCLYLVRKLASVLEYLITLKFI